MLRNFLIALTVAFASAAKRNWRYLEGYTFDAFLADFHLDYKAGTSEYDLRKGLFDAELARVIAHNAVPGMTWKETVNSMSIMTPQEKKALNGRHKGVSKAHKGLHATSETTFPKQKVSNLPRDVDWRTEGVVSAVKDQGHCGSCWAFASTAVMESHVAINSGLLFDLSPQQIAACSPNPDECGGTGNCQGATAEVAFDYAASSAGLLEEFQYGYSEYDGVESECAIPESAIPKATISGYVKLTENNYEELMNAVATVGPIAVSVDASEWHSYSSGIFDGCNQKNPDINHAVTLVGYGTDNGKDYWLIRNSWSASYGEAGYIRIARTSGEESRCGLDTTPHDGSACKGEDEPVTVCGTCGVLYDSSYPTGVALL